jgi:hypothetical protein
MSEKSKNTEIVGETINNFIIKQQNDNFFITDANNDKQRLIDLAAKIHLAVADDFPKDSQHYQAEYKSLINDQLSALTGNDGWRPLGYALCLQEKRNGQTELIIQGRNHRSDEEMMNRLKSTIFNTLNNY